MQDKPKRSIQRGIRTGLVYGIYFILVLLLLTYLNDIGFWQDSSQLSKRITQAASIQSTNEKAQEKQPNLADLPEPAIFNLINKTQIIESYEVISGWDGNGPKPQANVGNIQHAPTEIILGQIVTVYCDNYKTMNATDVSWGHVEALSGSVPPETLRSAAGGGLPGWQNWNTYIGRVISVNGNKLTVGVVGE